MPTAINNTSSTLAVTPPAYRLDGHEPPRSHPLSMARRDALRHSFVHTLIPTLRARCVTPKTLSVKGFGDPAALHWCLWQTINSHSLWALYASAHYATHSPHPANDSTRLVAWGDGPVLAWADTDPGLRRALHHALQHPPAFLSRGVVSTDPTLPQVTLRPVPSGHHHNHA